MDSPLLKLLTPPRVGETWMQERAVWLRTHLLYLRDGAHHWTEAYRCWLPTLAWTVLVGTLGAGILLLAGVYRAWMLRASRQRCAAHAGRRTRPASLALFLGSGGHTAELLQMAAALPSAQYTPRTYIVSSGDELSALKAHAAEAVRPTASADEATYRVITLPRARHVGQSWLTTPVTTLYSLAATVRLVLHAGGPRAGPWADVVLMNGPGTCVPLVVGTYLLRVLGQDSPRLVYIESFARVERLSLTGRLVRPFVDRFVVQWTQLAVRLAEAEAEAETATTSTNADSARRGAPERTPGTVECLGWLV